MWHEAASMASLPDQEQRLSVLKPEGANSLRLCCDQLQIKAVLGLF